MNTTPEVKRKRIEMAIKVLGLGVAGFIVAPFVFIAVKGLLGLALAAAVGYGIIYFTPVVASMIANWRLKAIKAEAMRNPVETLQNDYLKRQNALDEFKTAIVTFSAEVKNFADRLVNFSKQYPAEADKFKDQLSKMRQLLDLRQRKYQGAQDSLAAYSLEIEKAGAIWEMGQAAAKMNEAAGMSEDDWLAKIQTETALNSIQKNLNEAFAELEIAVLDEDKERAKTMYAEKQVNAEVTTPDSSKNTRQKVSVN